MLLVFLLAFIILLLVAADYALGPYFSDDEMSPEADNLRRIGKALGSNDRDAA